MDATLQEMLESRLRLALPHDDNLVQYIEHYTEAPMMDILTEGARLNQESNLLTEAVILGSGRPGLLIRQNTFMPTVPWQNLDAHVATLQACLPSVGRIEVEAGNQRHIVGTGWVFNNHIVTNRHVVAKFYAQLSSNPPRYMRLSGYNGRTITKGQREHSPYRAFINFRAEAGSQPSGDYIFRLKEPLLFPPESDPDVAVLGVERRSLTGHPLPPSLQLATTPATSEQVVAVVGHPANDPEHNPNPAWLQAFFQGHFGVKRLQPGRITGVTVNELHHDCTTTGGSSGSPLLDVQTGLVLGLHNWGEFMLHNSAVPAAVLADLFNTVLLV